jgi:hypothetical protein
MKTLPGLQKALVFSLGIIRANPGHQFRCQLKKSGRNFLSCQKFTLWSFKALVTLVSYVVQACPDNC